MKRFIVVCTAVIALVSMPAPASAEEVPAKFAALVAASMGPKTDPFSATELQTMSDLRARLQARATVSGPVGCGWVGILNMENGLLAAAERGWTGDDYGTLRARSTSWGEWEHFWMCLDLSTDAFTLETTANRFVTAELNWGGAGYARLRARSFGVSTWEIWYMWPATAETWAWSNARNGRFVTPELNWSGSDYAKMRARSTEANAWEMWRG